MSQFNEDDLNKLMKLCRIECSVEEKQKFLHSLSRIVTYMDQLNEVHTDCTPPCNHIIETLHNVMREDISTSSLSRDVFLANAPSHIGGMVRVPPVLKSSHS